jgi:DNA replication protein DnaC
MPRSRADAKEDMNVLLYGPRSIDKIGYVADRLAAEDLKAFTLADGIPERDRGAVCYFVQRYLAQVDPNAILVLPAADTILTRTRRGTKDMLFFRLEMDDEVEDTEADVVLLAKNPIKTVWLVNGAQRLSEDNLGRFLYSAEVRTASRAERKQEIETLLKDLDVGPELHQELSQHLRLSEQQITSASRLVEEMETIEGTRSWAPDGIARGSREYRASLVRRAIEQSQKAMDRRGREVLRQPITTYSLDLLHTSGAFSVQQILQSLKHRPAASLCFYGLPGTGKTQLAEHIAVTLDKPILAKRASDLMDKYVGGSEKLIREMFNEATEEDAVLFLDEADSFLTDRSRARQSYETSIVNEVLQGMERFPGVFICATNLFSRLDKAALRRFTFKVEFLELTEPQRWQMFLNETGIDEATVNPNLLQTWRGELEGTQMLTPGDFATLQRQCKLLGTELTPEQWLMGLAQEAKHKRDAIEAEGGQILR